ncbi:MAG TPA: hypothetical protein VNN19_13075 [bacterium]|nr:hypothetical protein [bacterium]
MQLLSVAALQLVILPLTWLSVRWLRVPERHELVAGIFLTLVYALLASTLSALLFG